MSENVDSWTRCIVRYGAVLFVWSRMDKGLKMKRGFVVAGVLCSLLFGGMAFAEESAPVDCDSFVITPPAGWLPVAGMLSEKELNRLPNNIREHYTRPTSDVIFIDLSSPDAADAKSFKDNLNVIAIGEAIPLSDELIAELTTVLKAQYSAMFENFVLESAEKSKLNDVDVLLIKGSYGVLNYAVKMEQVLYPASSNAYVMTCSYDAQSENSASVIAACRKAMESIQIKD